MYTRLSQAAPMVRLTIESVIHESVETNLLYKRKKIFPSRTEILDQLLFLN